jgi:hypothetical protein
MDKQTAGRKALGDLAPKFAELNDDVLLARSGRERTNSRPGIVALSPSPL